MVKVFFKKTGKPTKSTSTATLQSNGTRSLTVPKLAKGTWKIYVTYTGNGNFVSVSQKALGSVKVTQ